MAGSFPTPEAAEFPRGARSFRTTLPGRAVQTTPTAADFVQFIQPESKGRMAWPRDVQFISQSNLSFDVQLDWSSGGGAHRSVVFTALGGTARVLIQAVNLTVSCANWSSNPNEISVSAADTSGIAVNHLQRMDVQPVVAPAANVTFDVPPFGQQVRVTADTFANMNGLQITLVSPELAGAALVTADYTNAANAGTVPVGLSRDITIFNNNVVASLVQANFFVVF